MHRKVTKGINFVNNFAHFVDKGIHLKNWHGIYEGRGNLAFANIQGYLIPHIAMKGKALRFRQTGYRTKRKLSGK